MRQHMDTALIGKAKELEVAGLLVRNGLYVFFPLVDTGADLVVADRLGRHFVPVQVKYRRKDPALGLYKKDVERFAGTNTVLAFINGVDNSQRRWFIPYSRWRKKATDRLNTPHRMAYVTISKSEDWLRQYEGDGAIKRVFSKLLADGPGK
jgi:hypothetical protein